MTPRATSPAHMLLLGQYGFVQTYRDDHTDETVQRTKLTCHRLASPHSRDDAIWMAKHIDRYARERGEKLVFELAWVLDDSSGGDTITVTSDELQKL